MEHVKVSAPDEGRVFRLAYASRPDREMAHDSVASLANAAEISNLGRGVSGVLFSGEGVFLQWLEGQAKDVCGLMSKISEDARHTDVTVLSAGWIPGRRFPRWPMRLAAEPPARMPRVQLAGSAPYDTDLAMMAFDQAANVYRKTALDVASPPNGAVDFADRLINSAPDALPVLPGHAQKDLRVRAQLVDDVCEVLSQGWRQDTLSSAQISVGLASLNRLWQRAGRIADPVDTGTRHRTSIVVPPGSGEIIGAIVKADLLRAAGTSVRVVLESDAEKTFAAISRSYPATIIVTGSRAGLAGEQERSNALAERIHASFPDLPIHIGGPLSGPLRECPERVGFGRNACSLPAGDVEWVALKALAAISSQR